MKIVFAAFVAVLATSCYGWYLNNGELEDTMKRQTVVTKMCKGPVDLALLLDSSNSISPRNWNKVKDFAKRVVDSLGDISEKGSHISVITYSKIARVDFNFNTFKGKNLNAKNIKNAIDNLVQMKKSTYMDRAFEKAINKVFTIKAGMRTDKKIKKIILLMTDGMQTIRLDPYTPLDEATQPLKDKNVAIFTLGVGTEIALQELYTMATDGDHVFSATGFDSLSEKVGEMQLQTCDCYQLFDIGIIWDESTSVGGDGFELNKKAISTLIEKLHVGPKESHVGIIRYGERIKKTYAMSDNQELSAVKKAIMKLKFDRNQIDTKTSASVELAGQSFFKPGTLGNRENVEDVAILFTDGASNDGRKGADAQYIKNTTMIVVGIGKKIKREELLIFAHNKPENVIIAPTFKKLIERVDDIVKATCKKE